MNTPFKVHWAGIAEEDLKSIILYIAEDSLTNARSIFEKIKETASFLTHLPGRGRIVPELQDQGIFLFEVNPFMSTIFVSQINVEKGGI